MNSHAVWSANAWYEGYGTRPVAEKIPNAFGLYDMTGNLYEYCNDWYGDYEVEDVVDPVGPDTGSWHVKRGGSWGNQAFYLRSSCRTPSFPDYSYYFLGFRTVLPKL